MRGILLLGGLLLFLSSACNNKKEKTTVKKEAPEVAIKAPAPPAKKKSAPAPPKAVKKPDKYFLISGSFMDRDNAEKFKAECLQKGYESEIITRSWGANTDFLRVSYMSFPDRKQAIKAMTEERLLPGKEGVWVLVKK